MNTVDEGIITKNFYCGCCGSTTGLYIGYGGLVRCIGCLKIYRRGKRWQEVDEKELEEMRRMPPPPQPDLELEDKS